MNLRSQLSTLSLRTGLHQLRRSRLAAAFRSRLQLCAALLQDVMHGCAPLSTALHLRVAASATRGPPQRMLQAITTSVVGPLQPWKLLARLEEGLGWCQLEWGGTCSPRAARHRHLLLVSMSVCARCFPLGEACCLRPITTCRTPEEPHPAFRLSMSPL
jgi:hypothetical protein